MAELSVIETASALRQRFDQNEIRQLIQELASSESDIPISTTPRSVGPSSECERVTLAEEHICVCMCAQMSPSLWSALPDELLQLVFARLPLPKINQLRIISKKWNQRFSPSEDPEFMRACQEAHPGIFAMIIDEWYSGSNSVRFYDTKAKRWWSFDDPVDREHVVTMCAGDGGLVCTVSAAVDKEENPLFIEISNPLSRQWRLIEPPHPLSKAQPRMVQLVMDESRKHYKVLVVTESSHPSGHGMCMNAMFFCSETGVWTSTEGFPDLIFGYEYGWGIIIGVGDDDDQLAEILIGPCAYDCARRELLKFHVRSHPYGGASEQDYALVKDHLFVLHQEMVEGTDGDRLHVCVVSEFLYQGQNCEPSWVMLKDHKCEEFNHPPSSVCYHVQLKACRGFLLLKAENDVSSAHELTWLYDLSSASWQKIPAVPDSGMALFTTSFLLEFLMRCLSFGGMPFPRGCCILDPGTIFESLGKEEAKR